jgi:hypothetical protein
MVFNETSVANMLDHLTAWDIAIGGRFFEIRGVAKRAGPVNKTDLSELLDSLSKLAGCQAV